MPRPRPVERRRCLVACDVCKKRKEKCDGMQPCARCKSRNREDACTFGASEPSLSSNGRTDFERLYHPTPANVTDQLGHTHLETSSFDIHTPEADVLTPPKSASVHKSSRFLVNNSGKLIYLGDSATLSYLQSIRRIVERCVGSCSFTADKLRNQLLEAGPGTLDSGLADDTPLLDFDDLSDLTKQFFLSVSGVLDLFNMSYITERLRDFVDNPLRANLPDGSLFYLVFAIGAQNRSSETKDKEMAERAFNLGRHYVTRSFVDEPILVTVQALCLVSWYMLTACRRNAALMNLGTAVQAAYALGIHRHEANILFEHDARMLRERAWKSLRVCDLFLSASMGRPSITSNVDSNIPFDLYSNRLGSAMTRICIIFERILSEIYAKHAVSLEIAASISKQHREWTEELPQMLEFDRLSAHGHGSNDDISTVLGQSVVVLAYHYSIILLTRPFLAFCVENHLNGYNLWHNQATGALDETIYADACVDSAIKVMEVITKIAVLDGFPKRMPVLINIVFLSALTTGLAYFADYQVRGWALEQTLARSIEVLGEWGIHNPQATRYKQITELLKAASNDYARRCGSSVLEARGLQLVSLFGSVSKEMGPKRASTMPRTAVAHLGTSATHPNAHASSLVADPESLQSTAAMVPTSAAFQSYDGSRTGYLSQQYRGLDRSSEALEFGVASDGLNWTAFGGDEFPLFEMSCGLGW